MPADIYSFEFDINYSSTDIGVFTTIDLEGNASPPPPPGNYLLETTGTPLLLTTLGFLTLA